MIDTVKMEEGDEEMCSVSNWAPFSDGKDDKADDRKRKRLSLEERKQRSRERNRLHARKTRERKKMQMEALQQRMNELKEEGKRLRHMVDERNTVIILLGLNGSTPLTPALTTVDYGDLDHIDTKDNSSLDKILSHLENLSGTRPSLQLPGMESNEEDSAENHSINGNCDNLMDAKQPRKRGKYSPKERQRIRRERNRMHAKRTRDRKKLFLEASELIVHHLETENNKLVEFLERTNESFGDAVTPQSFKRTRISSETDLHSTLLELGNTKVVDNENDRTVTTPSFSNEENQDVRAPSYSSQTRVSSRNGDAADDRNEMEAKGKDKEGAMMVYSTEQSFSSRPVYPWIMNMA